LEEYRPISLVGAIYKIISKVLANRMKSVLHRIIDSSQSAFLRDRGLLESIVLANEVVEDLRKGKKSRIVIKVDYERSNRVNTYLWSVMW